MNRFAGRSGPIRLGMVGGGTGAFIGGVHRIAARLDGHYQLVAGALSSTPDRAAASAAALGLDPARSYGDFSAMARREARLKDGIEAVAIVTPNHLHAAAARAFLARGIHVICDKPLTAGLRDARALAAAVAKSDALFFLTHNYSGYPLVRQARAMVAAGDLGRIRVVQVEYPQDWLARAPHSKQAAWRADPAQSGPGGAIADIGTHAYHLLRFVTGLDTESLAADLHSFAPGGVLDDNGHIMLRLRGGARGMLWCSQVATGYENGLRLRVYGDRGGLDWFQENPNRLLYTPMGEPTRCITRAGAGALDANTAASRIPAGHPEGFLEGFANIYADAAAAIRAARDGQPPDAATLVPGIADGVEGMAFIDACVRSSRRGSAWVSLR